jgi:hypothetical protein
VIRLLLSLVLVATPYLSGVCPSQASNVAAQGRTSPPVSRKVALIVGNDSYATMPLQNARRDARAIEAELRALGFEAVLIEDADGAAFKKHLEAFSDQLRPDDVAFFFYAGHGVQVEGENYLLPVDYSGSSGKGAVLQGVSATRIQSWLATARVSLLVLDACRNNPYGQSRGGAAGLAPMEARGSLIAFATGAGQTASDNPSGGQGRFTGVLLDVLREPGLSIRDVFFRVRQRVHEISGGEQFPAVYDSLLGDVVLRPSAVASAAPAEAPSPARPSGHVDAPTSGTIGSASLPPPAPAAGAVVPPRWLVGDYRGVNGLTGVRVELSVQPDGTISGVAGAGGNNPVSLSYRLLSDTRMSDASGAYVFEIEKNDLGFQTRQAGSERNVVVYRRVFLPPGSPEQTDSRGWATVRSRPPSPDEQAALLAVISEFKAAWEMLDASAGASVFPAWRVDKPREERERSGVEKTVVTLQCQQLAIRRDQAWATCQVNGQYEFKRRWLSTTGNQVNIGGRRPPQTFSTQWTFSLFWNGSTWMIEDIAP